MECFIVELSDVDLEHRVLTLRGEEAHHAIRSLRLRIGGELLATDLAGTCYRCRIVGATPSKVTCSIEEVLPNFGEAVRDISLLIAVLSQPSRWEFVLEKATELGVREIQPVTTSRTERSQPRYERSEKVLRAAVKQTKRARIPILHHAVAFRDTLLEAKANGKAIILLHESASIEDSLLSELGKLSGQPIAIAVGPEGGFSDGEVAEAREHFGAAVASLGTRRLRAETAAMAALAIANCR